MWEKRIVQIEDDFDLNKICSCGQCFRAKTYPDGTYRFITNHDSLYMRQTENDKYAVISREGSWESVWMNYFDLTTNYAALRAKHHCKNDFIQISMEFGAGLRVLRQNPWEMLITFIISQRKNIPAISKAVEDLSCQFGELIPTPNEERLYAFPTPEALHSASEKELSTCMLGYRTPYVMDAAAKTASGALDISALALQSDEDLYAALMTIHGVGKKVANCVCLFGYGRISRAPVDVWIARAIEEEFEGHDPFPEFGNEAGIIQQYMFYYEKNRRTAQKLAV